MPAAMRLPLLLAALVLLALAPATQAQAEHTIPAGGHLELPIQANGHTFSLDVTADVPIDVIVVRGNATDYYNGSASVVWGVYNTSAAHADLGFPADQQLTLIVDNSPAQMDGAPGDVEAHADVRIQVGEAIVVPSPSPPPTLVEEDERKTPTLWHALMFTAPVWDLGAVGIGGVVLWLLLFCAAAAFGYTARLERLGVVLGGVAALTFLWALLPHPGMISQVGLPLLIGAGAGYIAAKGTTTLQQALRLAFLGAVLGALVGLTVGHYVHALWSDEGDLALGGERFLDAMFTLPLAAVAAAFLAKFVPAFVAALEDEERDGPQSTTQQAPTFTVNCIRCSTPITVNRSLKRYRVKTDHVEFACPNCNTWMEWAAPKPAQA